MTRRVMLLLLAAAPLAAQPTVRYGLVTEPARGTLVRAWGDSVESGYCVTAYRAAALRLYVVSVTGNGGTLACDVPAKAEVTAAMTGTFSGTASEIVVGRAVGLGASYAAMKIKRLLVLNAAPSAGDLALLQAWAPRYAGAVLF